MNLNPALYHSLTSMAFIISSISVGSGPLAASPLNKKGAPMLSSDVKQQKGMRVEISSDKTDYRMNEPIRLAVLLKNESESEFWVYNDLGWGDSSSFSLWVKDTRTGKDVTGQFLADALTPPPGSKDQFTKILPHYYFGFDANWRMKELNIDRPGSYMITVNYHSPIPLAFGLGLPIWSKEMGSVRSNSLKVQVNP